MHRASFRSFPSFLPALVAIGAPLTAQCSADWLPGRALGGIDGLVFAMASFDPSGTGAALRVTAGGQFQIAGASSVANIATFDAATTAWLPLGTGVNGPVHALAYLSNGGLIVGGNFTSAGSSTVTGLAHWNGTAWAPFGTLNAGGQVRALLVQPNGDVVVGGVFTSIDGQPAGGIARWDGATWSTFGGGVGGDVTALQRMQNGELVAGGRFSTAGGVAANGIARWNGSAWAPLGAGLVTPAPSLPAVLSMAETQTGDLIVGGLFSSAGGGPIARIARWDGTTWSPIGSGFNGNVNLVTVTANGDIVAGGDFMQAGGIGARAIARWDGQSWWPMGSGFNGIVFAATKLPGSDVLVVAGQTTMPGPFVYTDIAYWNGVDWIASTPGDLAAVGTIATRGNRLAIGGGVFHVGGTAMRHVAEWTGTTWHDVGGGTDAPVAATTYLTNGDLVVGGTFMSAGTTAASRIARWNGSAWQAFGTGANGAVTLLATSPTGDLVAAGDFTSIDGVAANRLARWNGSTWAPMGSGIGTVQDVAFAANGDMVAVGFIMVSSGTPPIYSLGCARWNGSTWSGMPGLGSTGAEAVAIGPAGEIYVGLANNPTSFVRRWNGTAWSNLGSPVQGAVHALEMMPDGTLVAGGRFTAAAGVPMRNIARWNGTAWAAFGSGTSGQVDVLQRLPDNSLAVGGQFAAAGGRASVGLARLASPCLPTAATTGAGCAGSAGQVTLTALTLPWLGSTFRATTSGVPANAIALAVTGFASAAIPLAAVLPQGVPGCLLHTTPDLLEPNVPIAGSSLSTLLIPGTTSLVGLSLWHQVVPVEFGGAGQIVALTSSNALALTIGTF